MAIMTINAVAKAGSASWTGNYSLIWSGLTLTPFGGLYLPSCREDLVPSIIKRIPYYYRRDLVASIIKHIPYYYRRDLVPSIKCFLKYIGEL